MSEEKKQRLKEYQKKIITRQKTLNIIMNQNNFLIVIVFLNWDLTMFAIYFVSIHSYILKKKSIIII